MRVRCFLSCFALLVFVTCIGSGARADGRIPYIGELELHPALPNTLVARGTFGVLLSSDTGSTWHWVCSAVIGARTTEDPRLGLLYDGELLAATTIGLQHGNASLCKWDAADLSIEGLIVSDVVVAQGTAPETAYAVTAEVMSGNGVYVSTSGGAVWRRSTHDFGTVLLDSVRVAPTSSMIVYVGGHAPATATTSHSAFIASSTDGATSFTSTDVPFMSGERSIQILAVDPTNARRLLVRIVNLDTADRVMLSEDGGATLRQVATMPLAEAAAWARDGSKVWLGSRAGGLMVSTDHGSTFSSLSSTLHVSCLAARAGELWACASEFTDGFALGVSHDDGVTFIPKMQLAALDGVIECAELDVAARCATEISDLNRHLVPVDAGTDDDAAAVVDAGPRDAAADASSSPQTAPASCACRSHSGKTSAETGSYVALAFLAIMARRRRPESAARPGAPT